VKLRSGNNIKMKVEEKYFGDAECIQQGDLLFKAIKLKR
jgi:hypothetical protein